MISLLQQYKRLLAWFISGLVVAFLVSIGTSSPQPASASSANNIANPPQSALVSDFAATHQEPNFYQ
ncbi:hypothetical protein [Fortiea contorta]|uniref:hypothetical protein n=1 Tax=Fortiea contorta TaxID=1892405 RepID=UPI00034C4039|nr:hypothetical protein [Fortiea contorta]